MRVKYDPHGLSWQIGSNPLTSDDGVWFALPDVVAAKLLSGKTPEILEAFRLEATGTTEGDAPDQAARCGAGRSAHTRLLSTGHRRA